MLDLHIASINISNLLKCGRIFLLHLIYHNFILHQAKQYWIKKRSVKSFSSTFMTAHNESYFSSFSFFFSRKLEKRKLKLLSFFLSGFKREAKMTNTDKKEKMCRHMFQIEIMRICKVHEIFYICDWQRYSFFISFWNFSDFS